MDSKDKRLILAILIAFILWGIVDFFFSPKPLVFLLGGENPYKPQEASKVELSELNVTPEVEIREVVRTVKQYEPIIRERSRDRILEQIRESPVIELSGVNEPTVLRREGGTINVSLRVKAYYAPVHHLKLDFTLPVGWEYIPGTTTNRFSADNRATEMKLASLEDRVEWTDAGEVVAQYLQEAGVEPSAELRGEPPLVTLSWTFEAGLKKDEAVFLEFPLQTTGSQLPGANQFLVQASALDRADANDPNALPLFAEVILRVDILDQEEALREEEEDEDWEELLLSGGIDRGYREPLSGVGF